MRALARTARNGVLLAVLASMVYSLCRLGQRLRDPIYEWPVTQKQTDVALRVLRSGDVNIDTRGVVYALGHPDMAKEWRGTYYEAFLWRDRRGMLALLIVSRMRRLWSSTRGYLWRGAVPNRILRAVPLVPARADEVVLWGRDVSRYRVLGSPFPGWLHVEMAGEEREVEPIQAGKGYVAPQN